MRTLMLIAAALLILGEFPAVSRASDHDDARKLSKSGTIVPLEQITAQVRSRPDIKDLLEVELESDADDYYYEVEVVDDGGVVRKLRYDATTGELIDESVDDD
ncbi:MAG: PepSY domain-containing protein [Gammaproteobacteria bacterium]|nr:PepSY domain-containing protein [Gammaproteobacteria bacterium]